MFSPNASELGIRQSGHGYAWRKRFGQLEAVDVKRLRQIETEKAQLKKLLAQWDLEIELMKEVERQRGYTPKRRRGGRSHKW